MCGSSPADNIETHVETAAVRVESGNKQLEKAVRHKVGDSYTCILMCMCWYCTCTCTYAVEVQKRLRSVCVPFLLLLQLPCTCIMRFYYHCNYRARHYAFTFSAGFYGEYAASGSHQV